MISVVMATYNGGYFLEKQINSILNQTIEIDELIICDDCSEDNTLGILKSIEDKRIKIHKNPIKLGYAKNFVNALKKVKGDIIFLSDQDDIWCENKVEFMVNCFESNSEILALNSFFEYIDENDIKISYKFQVKKKEKNRLKKIDMYSFLKSPRYPGMAMAIRSDLLSYIDFDNLEVPHDWILNFHASILSGLYLLEKCTTYYRQHANNTVGTISSSESIQLYEKQLQNICREIDYISYANKTLIKDDKIHCLKNSLIQRYDYFKSKKIAKYIIFYLLNSKFLSLKSFIGDLYILIFRKTKG